MKKILTLILAIVLCACTAMFTACGSSYFDGNYTEATKSDLESFAQEVEDADGEEIDFLSGLKVSMNIENFVMGSLRIDKMNVSMNVGKDTADATKYAMNADYYIKMNNGDNLMEADLGIVYKNDVAYVKTAVEGVESKIKYAIDDVFDALVMVEGIELLMMYDLFTAINMAEGQEGMKLYIDKGEETTKVKVAGDMNQIIDEDITTGKVEMIYVFNTAKKLIGLKIFMDVNMTMAGETIAVKVDMNAEPWSGDISAPSDADSYIGA